MAPTPEIQSLFTRRRFLELAAGAIAGLRVRGASAAGSSSLAHQLHRATRNSRVGAIGVMQLLPSTAAGPNVGIPNIEELEDNIHAGVKYLRFLRDRYFADPELDDLNATLLSFAAYNGGPNRIARLRREAAESGLDSNVWFRNVENVVAKRIGRETVQYVSNIYKYYIAYRLIADTIQIRGQG